jgi:3-deoxy-D-manno-octulosonate 8-phosphate phosphatase KdsC-like HAD superfamily phosphatase
MRNVNFSVAPADAPLEVKANSYYVTYGTGEEAVREVADLITKVKCFKG